MNIFNIVNKFLPDKDFVSFKTFGNGHINTTFLVQTTDDEYYVVQKINTYVFKDVDQLMNNIHQVTKHFLIKNVESIHMLKNVGGVGYVQDGDNFYRCYKYLPDTLTFEKAEGIEMIKNAAKAFGKFHNDVSDLDPNLLVETIPHFHDTPKRYNDLLKAIKEDKAGRVKEVKKEIETLKKYKKYFSYITDALKSGEVKLHITHNDPKINNALFDVNTKSFRSIIDLDTVMPGSVLYDFGDALRSLFTGDKEDTPNYIEVVPSFDIYKAYLEAYYAETKSFLTKREVELLPYAPAILAFELAIRFLEDYLNGDVYFKINKPTHNLDRARTQLYLGANIIGNIHRFEEITKEVTKK